MSMCVSVFFFPVWIYWKPEQSSLSGYACKESCLFVPTMAESQGVLFKLPYSVPPSENAPQHPD